MKTTVEISDALMAEAKSYAKENGTTLRAVLEEGVRLVVKETRKERHIMKDKSFPGGELINPNLTWDEEMELIYGDRL